MNLLDKYINQVGKHLPRKNRLDLQTEIRSTLEDMLEDRSRETGRPVDDALMAEVLAEYGSPEKVAAAYKPTRYLIGPRLYPFFEMVVKIVFAVLLSIAAIGFAITFVGSGLSKDVFLPELGKHASGLLTGLMSAFGNIVLVFAIMERVKPDAKFDEESEKWTPADLNAEADPNQVGRGEMIFEIIFISLGLAVLNLFPQLIGFGMVNDGGWIFYPALSEAFFRYLPWINVLGVLEILLDLYLMRAGMWRTNTRLLSLALQVAGIALAIFMLTGPSLVNLPPERIAEVFGETGNFFKTFFDSLPKFVLTILIVVQTIEALQLVWKLITRRSLKRSFLPK